LIYDFRFQILESNSLLDKKIEGEPPLINCKYFIRWVVSIRWKKNVQLEISITVYENNRFKKILSFIFLSILGFFVLFFILNLLFVNCNTKDTNRNQQIQDHFKNPPQSYLPTVYWFWNGKIEYDQIKWQLAEMKRSNTVSSVCILAWEGLAIEYLSDEWFDKVKYACQVAKELSLNIWLYDEIRWPSGHAGGKVLESNPEFVAKCLAQTEQKIVGGQKVSIPINTEPVAIIAGRLKNDLIDESSLIDVTSFFDGRQFRWTAPEGEWSLFIYRTEHCTFKPTFLDREYVDLLDPRVAQTFINLTHEVYYQRIPDYFGSVIKAIITDEPGCYCNLKAFMISPETVPWTSSLFKAFESRKTYCLKKYLPALWQNIGAKTAQVRIDFYDVISDLLQESYFKPLYDWCENHNIQLNIQPAHEETMKYSTILQGDYFKAMEYSHLMGADEVYSWDKKNITPIIASSAARSFGKQDLYCEVFGAYGWDVTLEKMKAVTDWLFTRGVNRLLLSSFYFAMEGDWQFEIPPSLFYQNTQWQYLPNYTEYVQRLSYLLSGGRNISQIAVLYPNKSVQALLTPLNEKLADQIDSSFLALSNFLLENQLDFDYLDERTLNKAEISEVEGKVVLRLNQKNFWIDYQLLILPLMQIIEAASLQKIKDFYNQGGKIIAYGDLPRFSPNGIELRHEINQIWRDKSRSNNNNNGGLAGFIKADFDSIKTIINQFLVADVRLESPQKSISYIHKVKNDLDIYFISNHDSTPINTSIAFSMTGIPQIWNPEDGKIQIAAEFQNKENRTIMPLRLDRCGSLVIVFDHEQTDIPHVIKSNLKVEQVAVRGDSAIVSASIIVGGENYLKISWQGKEFEKRFSGNPIEKIELPDLWDFKPKDNSFPAEIRRSGSWTEKQNIDQPDGSKIAPARPYFSGTGIYTQTFHLDEPLFKANKKFVLELGQINDLVELWLNGQKVGERGWHPFSFDITKFIKEEKMISN